MGVRDDAEAIAPELAALRRAIHREPGDRARPAGTPAQGARRPGRAAAGDQPGTRAQLGHRRCCGAGRSGPGGDAREDLSVLLRGDMDALPVTERTGLDYASQTDGRHARLRARPAHRHAGRGRPGCWPPASASCPARWCSCSSRGGRPRRRLAHDRRGRSRRRGRAPGGRLRAARRLGRLARRSASSPAGADARRGRGAGGHRPRPGRARLRAPSTPPTRSRPPARW